MKGHRDTSGPGQALEFEIWSDLIKQSQGTLHVFLPLLDRGFDAVVHRMIDGRYIPLQIKGRGEAVEGMVEIMVRGDSLVDDNAVLIGSFMRDVPDKLDLVVEEGTFKKLAARDVSQGHVFYSAAFSMHPRNSHWRPNLVPRSELAERLLGTSIHHGSQPARGLSIGAKRTPQHMARVRGRVRSDPATGTDSTPGSVPPISRL